MSESSTFMGVFRRSEIPVCLVDPAQGSIVEVNKAAARLFGYPAEHYPGLPIEALLTGAQGAADALIRDCLTRGECGFPSAYRTASDETRKMEVRALALDRNSSVRLLLTLKDLAEERPPLRQQEGEDTFQRLLSDIPSVSVQGYTMDGTTFYWNKASEQLYGYTQQEAVGKSLLDLIIPPDMHRQVEDSIARMVAQGVPEPAAEFQLMRKDGTLVDVFSSHALLQWPGTEPQLFCLDIDISERKIARQLRLAASVFTNASEPMLVTDADRRIIRANDAFLDTFGYSAEELLGKLPRAIHAEAQDPACDRAIWAELYEKGSWTGEMLNRKKNGQVIPNIVKANAVKGVGERPVNYIISFTDLTLIKAQEEALKRAAYFDALTGLPNRNLLNDRIGMAIKQRRSACEQIAIFYIDLDGFKAINDTYGHTVGDDFLRIVSENMVRSMRKGETLARLGGDEFVAVLDGVTNRADCMNAAKRMLAAVGQPIFLLGHRMRVTASIGVALFPTDAREPDALLRMADHAMYQAKSDGKSRCVFYDEIHPGD